jgi:hypothetical protein
MWIKGHANVEGNESVDLEAKKVTERKPNKARNLPSWLSKDTLPLSISAVRQEHERKLKEDWKERWNKSLRYPKLSRIDSSMPFNKYG